MWLVEEWGTDKFREMVGQQMGGVTLRKGIEEHVRAPQQTLQYCFYVI